MQQSQRVHANPALEYAVLLANEQVQAVVVSFGLRCALSITCTATMAGQKSKQLISARIEELFPQPQEVHIYSNDRPVPNRDIFLVPEERLETIADRGRKETGVEFTPFYSQ